MKKLLIRLGALVYLVFVFLSLLTYKKEYNTVSAFEEVNGYMKDSFYFDGLSLEQYKNIFINYKDTDYHIYEFNFQNNYNNIVTEEINNIEIDSDNYLISLSNYINEYVKVLDRYNMEDEKAKIINGNFIIIKISLVCTKDIYEELEKITLQ